MRRTASLIALCVVLTAGAAVSATQRKPTLTPADYDQFERLSGGASRGGLSPDGRWLAYGISRVGGDNELRVAALPAPGGTASAPKVIAFGTQAVFNATSEWLAYSIGQSDEEQERLRAARQPVQRKLGLLHLPTQTETIIDGVESFAFDATGASIAMQRYAAAAPPAAGSPTEPTGGGRGGAPSTAGRGAILVVRTLGTGADLTFGNVSEFAWQNADTGRLLAMTISANDRAGNGIHLYDAATSVVRVLDAAPFDYSGLLWRDDSADLVAMRSHDDEARDGPTQMVLAWTGVGGPDEQLRTLDPTSGILPATQRVVPFRRPAWFDRGVGRPPAIIVGVADWKEKPPTPSGERGGRGGRGAPPQDPDVDVWHWADPVVMARQKLTVSADARRSFPAVWQPDASTLVVVGQSFDEQVTLIEGSDTAVVSDFRAYLMERSIGRGAADVFLANLTTGARTPLKTGVAGNMSVSASGRYLLFADNGHYWTIHRETHAITNITRTVKTSFADRESDSTSPEVPMYGVAGWTTDDAAVVLYDKFDLWSVTPDGTGATRLTNGAAEDLRYRYQRTDPDADTLDLASGYLRLFGLTTKRSGYGRFSANGPQRLVWLDKSVAGLARAEDADVYVYTVEGADDSPDIFVGGPDLSSALQTTATNAFMGQYAWGRTQLVEYSVEWKGQPKRMLQGSLYYPANYDPNRTYPMVVYLYERLSDGLHRFTPPSERDYYNGTALTQQDYFYFQPDIIFQPREPGVSVVACVTAAVNAVLATGMVDRDRIGVMGHSWGGFDAMYLATHSKLFAAAVSGAGISNLISNYGNHHWSSGIAETDHIETGQQRMVVPVYDDLQAYIRNSAVFGISTMTTPLLLMTGDDDGTVYWHQSVELYNIARRARKNVVMLVYNNEGHGLRTPKNQVDYHRRIQSWFAHYLKGEPAPAWITEGVPARDRD